MTAAFKNEQIYFLLYKKIVDGELSCGMRLPSEEQLARELHVGRVTLRSALKRLEEQKFVRRVRGQGTFVVYSPENTVSATEPQILYRESIHIKHKLLLLASKDKFRSSSLEICSGVLARAMEKNVEVVRMDYDFFRQCITANKAPELIERENITGIILPFHGFIGNEPELEFFRQLKIPVLLPLPWDSDIFLNIFKTFDSPIRPAMYALLRHLNKLGHRKIAFIGPDGSRNIHLLSEQEYRILTDRNTDLFITAPPEPEAISAALREYLKKNQPTAIFCYDSIYAFSVTETLKSLQMRIPEDISAVEFANSTQTAYSDPPVSSCDLKLTARGRMAVDYLISGARENTPQIGFELAITNSVKSINNIK